MAKRGRKPKEKEDYFSINEEEAILQYISSTDDIEKNRIFNRKIYPALTKMIESIIRTYKLFVPDEDFEDNFNDTFSYLLMKINNYKQIKFSYEEILDKDEYGTEVFTDMEYSIFKTKQRDAEENDPKFVKVFIPQIKHRGMDDVFTHEKRYYKLEQHYNKAYSYLGTICRNYLTQKCVQYTKNKQRNIQYDDISDEINNNIKYSDKKQVYNNDTNIALIEKTADQIEEMIKNDVENQITNEEKMVGNALITLLRNWEEVLPYNGSNKLQKNAVLYFLREETMMTTKEIRVHMKKYKSAYYLLKEMMIQNNVFDTEEI